ncbi:hypothetical protein A2U01_0062806, partial [Trifolium medium]|nr:hypothetical protein [Trifolium medium]
MTKGTKGTKGRGGNEEVVQEKGRVVAGSKGGTVNVTGGIVEPNKKLVRVYRSTMEDLTWARKGVVATVVNGEAVPL